jgi:hypothetical protein
MFPDVSFEILHYTLGVDLAFINAKKKMHLRSGEESDRAWEEKIGDHHTYEGHIYGHVAVDKTFPILTEQT